jgi:hypothetical protein
MSPKILGLVLERVWRPRYVKLYIRDISRQKRADILLLFDEGS